MGGVWVVRAAFCETFVAALGLGLNGAKSGCWGTLAWDRRVLHELEFSGCRPQCLLQVADHDATLAYGGGRSAALARKRFARALATLNVVGALPLSLSPIPI